MKGIKNLLFLEELISFFAVNTKYNKIKKINAVLMFIYLIDLRSKIKFSKIKT